MPVRSSLPPSSASAAAVPARRPRPTIRSVAERASVAISTVSRVVNGGRASEAVRRKVLRAIDDLGYKPSIAAQSLVSRRTGCIGLAVNSSQSPWFSQILAGVEETLAPSRKSVLLGSMMLNGSYDPSTVLAWLQDHRIDGLIMVRHSTRDQPVLDAALEGSIPIVLIAPDMDAPAAFRVRCNNVEAGRLATAHLTALGHRTIAFAGGPRESVDSRMRLFGVEEGLQAVGASLDPRNVWFGAAYGRASGIEYAEQFLARQASERPSAVILGNDTMALGFMRRVLSAGVNVPADVSVVGFDGTPDGDQCWPGLTTVEQPTRRMAAEACAALLKSIDSTGDESSASVEYPVELLLRESTAVPPRRD